MVHRREGQVARLTVTPDKQRSPKFHSARKANRNQAGQHCDVGHQATFEGEQRQAYQSTEDAPVGVDTSVPQVSFLANSLGIYVELAMQQMLEHAIERQTNRIPLKEIEITLRYERSIV
jgi:hypothetical protein